MKKAYLILLFFCLSQANCFAQIRITKVADSFDFPDAKLGITSINLLKGDTLAVQFNVENYTLGNQTPDAVQRRCANSDKGQHIHFILDNQPYTALYKPNHKIKIADGTHQLITFLSRSYHESIKSKRAYNAVELSLHNGVLTQKEIKGPMLFYSRPKGNYIGADTARVLLDFYVINTKLSEKGTKVRATINESTFSITDWKPYLIEGLPMGESTIKLELLDSKGKQINTVTRKILLAAQEPIKK